MLASGLWASGSGRRALGVGLWAEVLERSCWPSLLGWAFGCTVRFRCDAAQVLLALATRSDLPTWEIDDRHLHQALTELGMDPAIDHVTDFSEIAAYGVMTTPALVVDGRVVSFGKVLKKDEVKTILQKLRG